MKKQHILFSNYHWENDEYGNDHYDYAREEIWENDEEHKFTDEDYTSEQLSIAGEYAATMVSFDADSFPSQTFAPTSVIRCFIIELSGTSSPHGQAAIRLFTAVS